jgi:UDP-2,4-diacetamido-2,4,6-trideoxy-beta-L-altropyranose hydrolase
LGARVVFRTDASSRIGSGHLMRCLTLAEGLRSRGARVAFVSREHDGHLLPLIAERGFAIHALPAPADGWLSDDRLAHGAWLGAAIDEDIAQTLAALREENEELEWLIVDHYGVDARWERPLRSVARRIMVIDDLADRKHDCDLLLDQNLVADFETRYVNLVPQKCTLLLGPTYALLQPAYAELRERASAREGPARRILVFFGGIDPFGLTEKSVRAFMSLKRADVQLDVVVGRDHFAIAAIERLTASHPNVVLHSGLPTLAPLMAEADLAIGAGGATTWERLCLQIPTILIAVADNQMATARELHRRGLAEWLGRGGQVDEAMLRSALSQRMADPVGSIRRFGGSLVDGLGEPRVWAAMMADADTPLTLRPANERDEELLLEWANDPATRRNAFTQARVTSAGHKIWLQAKLNEPGCRMFILETVDKIPVGQVRFDREGQASAISYSVAPLLRGRGLGAKILEIALSSLACEGHNEPILGRVKPTNLASRRIFEKLGFALVGETADALEFRRTLS